MAKKDRATKQEILAREETVMSMLANCTPQSQILGYLYSEGYTEGSANNFLTKVRESFIEIGKERMKEQLEYEITRIEQLISQANQEGDRRSKLEYIKLLHKLKGLEQTNINVTGNINPISIVLNK